MLGQCCVVEMVAVVAAVVAYLIMLGQCCVVKMVAVIATAVANLIVFGQCSRGLVGSG